MIIKHYRDSYEGSILTEAEIEEKIKHGGHEKDLRREQKRLVEHREKAMAETGPGWQCIDTLMLSGDYAESSHIIVVLQKVHSNEVRTHVYKARSD